MSTKRYKAAMGLHTKDEKDFAYVRARRAFDRGMKNLRHQVDPWYALGYLEAIIELAKHEDATDLLEVLVPMHHTLQDAAAGFVKKD